MVWKQNKRAKHGTDKPVGEIKDENGEIVWDKKVKEFWKEYNLSV